MTETRILVGHERFNVGTEYEWLAGRDEDGAVVTFTGKVRNHNLGDSVKALTLDGAFENVAALRAHLAAQSDRWALALDEGKLLAAVNQTLVELTHPLADGDEVAFFPPVTGG